MAIIRRHTTPKYIYRYRALNDVARELSAIRTGHIFAAGYESMNDPMEGLYSARGLVREPEQWRRAREAIRSGKAGIGIASFSEGRANHLMWAHYAGGFTGMCIEYDFSSLLAALPDAITFARVTYSDQLPTVSRTGRAAESAIKAILSTKSVSWMYEREWRMFAPRIGKQSYGDEDVISAVYLGPRIKEDVRELVVEAVSAKSIRLFDAEVTGYDIAFEAARQN